MACSTTWTHAKIHLKPPPPHTRSLPDRLLEWAESPRVFFRERKDRSLLTDSFGSSKNVGECLCEPFLSTDSKDERFTVA